MTRIYISGPMTGIPDLNAPAFHAAAAVLRDLGHDVINPAENIADDHHDWRDHMRCDLRLLLTCEAVAMLPGWERSRGARLERHAALELGMPCHSLEWHVVRAERLAATDTRT